MKFIAFNLDCLVLIQLYIILYSIKTTTPLFNYHLTGGVNRNFTF